MHTSKLFLHLGATLSCAAGIANAAYTISDTYDSSNFFSDFTFFTQADPTSGFVEYVSAEQANETALAGYVSGDAVYLGVDHTTMNPTGGRNSVRVASNKAYNSGLFIADISHMPGGICGVWPAFWTFGPNWPNSGEIDIIEGVNQQTTDSITLHTSAGCNFESTGSLSTSTLSTTNCNAGSGDDGCSFSTAATNGFGTGFNGQGGGVYAMEWTASVIQVWFFPRSSIPKDIAAGNPDPTGWGTPTASFSGDCNITNHFLDHNIVFDTTFCKFPLRDFPPFYLQVFTVLIRCRRTMGGKGLGKRLLQKPS